MKRALVLATLLAAGCAGKRISDLESPPTAAPAGTGAWTIPAGVVVPSTAHGAADVDGLYPSLVAGDRRCCWLATDATVETAAPSRTRGATIAVLVPDYPFFESTAQTLTIDVGGTTYRFAALTPGVHRLTIAFANAGARPRVRFRCARDFVPAREHVNDDTRNLGIILLGMTFR